jgi:hypothetical protein
MSRRIGFLMLVVVLVAAAAVPMALGSTAKATGTVIVKVKYKTPDGKAPLAGVEVFLFDGSANYRCTNPRGVASFTGVEAARPLVTITGYSIAADCDNGEFLNPENGRPMWLSGFQNRHGEGPFDNFEVDPGGRRVIKLTVKTPARKKVCAGSKVTIAGTNAGETIVGTDEDDVINALGGNDTVLAGAGNDTVCGGRGSDDLSGDAGDDWLLGEEGGDDLDGGPGVDRLNGGTSNDMCVDGETLLSCEA